MPTAKEIYQKDPDYLRIFSTDLRDGRQGLSKEGDKMSREDAVLMARSLNDFRADIVEVGFGGPTDSEIVQAVIPHLTHSTVGVFARDGVTEELEQAFDVIQELVVNENRGRICMLTKTGQRVSSGLPEQVIVDRMTAGTKRVAQLFNETGRPIDLYTYFEGASEAPPELLHALMQESKRIIHAEMKPELLADADLTYGICDTNGSARRGKLARITRLLMPETNENVRLAVHAHNDFGLALSESLAAIDAGARQVDGCMGGEGERYGNVNLSAVIGNVYYDDPSHVEHDRVRAALADPEVTPLRMGVDVSRMYEVSHVVAQAFGEDLPFKAPFVGPVGGKSGAGMHNAEEMRAGGSGDFAFKTVDPRHFGVPEGSTAMHEMMGGAGVRKLLEEHHIIVPRSVARRIAASYSEVGGQMSPGQFIERFVRKPDIIRHIEAESASQAHLKLSDSRVELNGKLLLDLDEVRLGEDETLMGLLCAKLTEVTGMEVDVDDSTFRAQAYRTSESDHGADADVISEMEVVNGERRRGFGVDKKNSRANVRAFLAAVNSLSFWKEKKI
ncbi:MAG: hypothetical protein OEY44_02590 [Candidatus Peregrinibacteria bacterium]|nr:hypothetical protein [Candidatus Peregrinibacteria bacterium]